MTMGTSGSVTTGHEALSHALVRVVAERGWAQTSPQRVAREAGLPPHEFWDHYRSLEHCFVKVYDRMLARLMVSATRAVASRPLTLGRQAWQDQLEAAIGAVLTFLSVEPMLARACIVEGLAVGPIAREHRDAALGRFVSYVEGLHLSHGEPMPPLAAEMIALGTYELIYTRVARGEAEQLPDMLPELRRMWTASVEAHSPPVPAPSTALAAR